MSELAGGTALTAEVEVRVECFHGRLGGEPVEVHRRKVMPAGVPSSARQNLNQWFEANPDHDPQAIRCHQEMAHELFDFIKEGVEQLEVGARGRWIDESRAARHPRWRPAKSATTSSMPSISSHAPARIAR